MERPFGLMDRPFTRDMTHGLYPITDRMLVTANSMYFTTVEAFDLPPNPDQCKRLIEIVVTNLNNAHVQAVRAQHQELLDQHRLGEDYSERLAFNRLAELSGGYLLAIATTLRIWSATLPPQGSLAKTCVVMSNTLYDVVARQDAERGEGR